MPSASAAPVRAACASLLRAVPDRLGSHGPRRRPVTGDPTRTAAWGDPAVTLRCGVPLPDQTVTPLVIDGFPLVTEERGGQVTYTTSDRGVNAQVVVPKAYADQGYLVLALLPALKQLPAPTAAPGA